MNRRRFIELAGVGAAATLTRPAFASFFRASDSSSAEPAVKPYGSGHFGEWFTDDYGLPAYRYTCDQLTDPHARTLTHPDILAANDHLHLVGNDRVVGVASNFGHIQVRQDEGAPKYLNDYAPAEGLHGAGIGWLTDGTEVVSTQYSGPSQMARIFGLGYMRKIARGTSYKVDQTLFAPYGDDPVLISLVTITNHSAKAADLCWVEYWGACNYQFSYRATMEAGAARDGVKFTARRRNFARRFEHNFELAGNRGLLEKQRFLGRDPEEEALWQKMLAAKQAPETARGASFDDLNPPPTFLVSLDGPVDGYGTNAAEFFGKGSVVLPEGIRKNLNGSLSAKEMESAHLLERAFTLEPGQSRTIAFLYGYLPEGFTLAELLARYEADPAKRLAQSSARWKQEGIQFRTPAEPWVEREILWHNYYLRGALTYDSFFREHILSQGCVYQHVLGFQGAARDPLQHVLPFLFSDPDLVRQVLRYTLKEIQPDGSLPYALVGAGVPMPSEFLPSDQEMWLLWVLAEYVLSTRDKAFLDERIPLYPRHDLRPGDPTVGELAMRSFRHLVDVIGVGEHGLARVLMGDWNDMIVIALVPNERKAEVGEKGESLLNAAMASYVLAHYARMLAFAGDAHAAMEAHTRAQAQSLALRAQWAGRWFKRAWLGPHLDWLGADHLWLEPQPWAILGGAATDEQTATLIRAIDELARKPSPIGATIQSSPTPGMTSSPGFQENCGVWPSINGTLIWALAQHDGAMAWDEWKKNSLARHAEAYPNIWYGIWSGPDTFNSIYSDHPGETQQYDPNSVNKSERNDWGFSWTDFPVMCQHQHAWPLYTAAKLLGLEFHESGLRLAPQLPLDEFAFESPLLGMKKSKSGYTGWYKPAVAGTWEIEIHLPQAERMRLAAIKINGAAHAKPEAAAPIKLRGESQPGKPLRWELAWT
jgi:hypothetical protein